MKTFKSFKVEMFEAMSRSPYAIGMAQAMKSTGDKLPLEKSTIKKAHKIAKAVMRKEEVENDEQHLCAKHVYSDIFGEGIVLEAEHAEPDENGNIEWYSVKFDHGDEIVYTEDLEILVAEYHNNHSKKKKEKENKDEVNEKLHPNQQKLDVHEPEKDELTAADFAKLRAMRKKGK